MLFNLRVVRIKKYAKYYHECEEKYEGFVEGVI